MIKITPTKPQFDIICSRQQVNLFLAGQGSEKTHCAGIVSGALISQFPNVTGLIAANTYDQLNKATMLRVREVWKELGILEYDDETGEGCYVVSKKPPAHFNTERHSFYKYNNIISFSNGAIVFLASLENYMSVDGIEISWGILDETKDTREEAVKQVILGRLRQSGIYVDALGNLTKERTENPFNPLYIFTSPAKVQWLNEFFELDKFQAEIEEYIYNPPAYFKREVGNKLVVISSTHLNQANLQSNYISNQMQNLPKDLQKMNIYGNPFSKAGDEAYKGFERIKHVGKSKQLYDKGLPLHISFDFNTKPYLSIVIFQLFGKKAYQIDELGCEFPDNTSERACKKFATKYAGHTGGIYVYGDPSGKAESTVSADNNYSIIFRELAKFKPVMNRILRKAPSVVNRIQFINTIFENNYQGLEYYIDESCKHTVNDFLYVKEDSDGTKLKEKEKKNGVTYEKLAHMSDAIEYLLCSAYASEFSKFSGKGGTAIPIVIRRPISEKLF